ncbi:C40 family peptidase [Streptomyces sp. gCLA4]|uniref:C40 family peptidase n=1 Tax=Streptomyces sp. gCLA4 TaxID=1873416 RepID=UPI0037DCDED3
MATNPGPTQGPNAANNATLIGRIDALNRVLTALVGSLSGRMSTGQNTTAANRGPGLVGGLGTGGAGGSQTMNQMAASNRSVFASSFASAVAPAVFPRMQQVGGGSGGFAPVGHGRAAEVGGAIAGQAARSTMNAMANSDFFGSEGQTASDLFGRQMSMAMPMPGTAWNKRPKAYANMVYGSNLRGAQNYANSDTDIYSAGMVISQQAGGNRATMNMLAASATTSAFLTPGLGATASAEQYAPLYTAQGFYAQQQFGLSTTRQAGGAFQKPEQTWLDLANRVNQGDWSKLSPTQLQAQLMPGGSLSTSISNFGRTAGLSQTAQTSGINYLQQIKALTASGMSEAAAQETITKAAGGDKSAAQRMEDAGVSAGLSLTDARAQRKGAERATQLNTSDEYLKAAQDTADYMKDIHGYVERLADRFAPLSAAKKEGGWPGLLSQFGRNIKENFKAQNDAGLANGKGGGWLNMVPIAGPYLTNIFGDEDEPQGTPGGPPSLNTVLGNDRGTPKSKQGEPDHAGVPGIDKYKKTLPSGSAQSVIDFARSQVGKPYILGANGPDAWDCSSLVQAAYRAAGVSIDRTTYTQIDDGQDVPMDQLQPGDLVFYNDLSHVGLYAGGGSVVEAANPKAGVVEKPIGWSGKYTRAIRVMNGGVVATKTLGGKSNDPTKSYGAAGVGGFGSVNEIDALGVLLSGGGGGSVQQRGSTPSAQQNSEAASGAPAAPSNPTGTRRWVRRWRLAMGGRGRSGMRCTSCG